MKNISYLELPNLPLEIIQHIFELIRAQDNTQEIELLNANEDIRSSIENFKNNRPKDGLGLEYSEVKELPDGRSISRFSFLDIDNIIKTWIEENIGESASINLQIMEGGNSVIPHIDEIRTRAYNYIIDTGGLAETCFYKVKDEYAHFKVYPQTYIPYEFLEKIEGEVIQSHKWHQLNVSNIHSVECLDPNKKRIALTVSFIDE